MILIGSRAATFFFDDFRVARDWDVVTTAEELHAWVKKSLHKIKTKKFNYNETKLGICLLDGTRFEFEIIYPNSSNELLVDLRKKYRYNGYDVADPVSLYLIKKSHIHYPVWWRKNIEDYHYLKTKIGTIDDAHQQFYELRKKETDEKHKGRKTNLNMTNEEFFEKSEKAVKRVYNHDDLHIATCYYDEPLYDSLKLDKKKAAIDKNLFDKLSDTDKIKTVQEECYAIALERKVIPALESGEEVFAEDAFVHALERISTTLTSGWFRDFAIENYFSIRNYDKDYVSDFIEAVDSGKIKRLV